MGRRGLIDRGRAGTNDGVDHCLAPCAPVVVLDGGVAASRASGPELILGRSFSVRVSRWPVVRHTWSRGSGSVPKRCASSLLVAVTLVFFFFFFFFFFFLVYPFVSPEILRFHQFVAIPVVSALLFLSQFMTRSTSAIHLPR